MPNTFDEQTQPPIGQPEKAEEYIIQLISLVSRHKLEILHTDLAKFDPSSLQDHYRMAFSNYEVEVSHSKQPDTGKDYYVMLFNNLKQISQRCTEKVILAYMYLDEGQFRRFKRAAQEQLEHKKKAEEEKKLNQALEPIKDILDSLNDGFNTRPAPAEPKVMETIEVSSQLSAEPRTSFQADTPKTLSDYAEQQQQHHHQDDSDQFLKNVLDTAYNSPKPAIS